MTKLKTAAMPDAGGRRDLRPTAHRPALSSLCGLILALSLGVGGCVYPDLEMQATLQRQEERDRVLREKRAADARAQREREKAEWEAQQREARRQREEQERLRQEEASRRAEQARQEQLRRDEEEARRKAEREEQERRILQERQARFAELGLRDWGEACTRQDLMSLLPEACAALEGTYLQEDCEHRRKTAIKERWVFLMPVVSLEKYEADKRRFRITIPHLLFADTALPPDDCWEGCHGTWISIKPMKVSGPATNFPGWLERFNKVAAEHIKTAKTAYAPVDDISDPSQLEKQLYSEALVRIVDVQQFYVGDWFQITNVQVQLAGLQSAVLPGLDWGKVLIDYKKTPTCGKP